MLLCSIKAVLLWLAMMFVGGGALLGFLVRGVLEGPPIPPEEPELPALQHEYRRYRLANVAVTLTAAGLTAAYFWALFRYLGGRLAVIAAAMIMVARLPDLLTEIETGKPITRETMTRGPLDYLAVLLMWGALPVAWFALCRGPQPAS